MINPVIRVILHIRFRDENIEFARDGVPHIRPFPSYLSGHFVEMVGISPHTMNEHLSTMMNLQSDRVKGAGRLTSKWTSVVMVEEGEAATEGNTS